MMPADVTAATVPGLQHVLESPALPPAAFVDVSPWVLMDSGDVVLWGCVGAGIGFLFGSLPGALVGLLIGLMVGNSMNRGSKRKARIEDKDPPEEARHASRGTERQEPTTPPVAQELRYHRIPDSSAETPMFVAFNRHADGSYSGHVGVLNSGDTSVGVFEVALVFGCSDGSTDKRLVRPNSSSSPDNVPSCRRCVKSALVVTVQSAPRSKARISLRQVTEPLTSQARLYPLCRPSSQLAPLGPVPEKPASGFGGGTSHTSADPRQRMGLRAGVRTHHRWGLHPPSGAHGGLPPQRLPRHPTLKTFHVFRMLVGAVRWRAPCDEEWGPGLKAQTRKVE